MIQLLTILSILCEGSNLVKNTDYETTCQEYYVSCDDKTWECTLEHQYIYNMQYSPIQRF